MVVQGSLSKTVTWSVWVGSQEEFLRVLRSIERQFDLLVAPAVEKHVQWASEQLHDRQEALADAQLGALVPDGSTQGVQEYYRAEVAKQEGLLEAALVQLNAQSAEARRWFDLVVRVTEPDGGERIFRGDSAEIGEVFEGQPFKQFSVTMSGRYSEYSIKLSGSKQTGLQMVVGSSDERWARAAISELEALIQRQVPWWRLFLRTGVIWAVVCFVSVAGLWISVDHISSDNTSLLILWLLVPSAAIFFGTPLVERYAERVQIVQPGRKARGAGIAATVGGVLLTVPVGVFINWIS